jgi:hypothetical protein
VPAEALTTATTATSAALDAAVVLMTAVTTPFVLSIPIVSSTAAALESASVPAADSDTEAVGKGNGIDTAAAICDDVDEDEAAGG